MPSGFRVDADAWVTEFESCKALAQEVVQMIQERNTRFPGSSPEASRLSAAARKKIGTLGVQLDKLARQLDSPELVNSVSEAERNRRRDQVGELRARREGMQGALKRHQPGASDRDALLQGGSGPGTSGIVPRETEQTAELDARGLLSLQQQVMDQQDAELEDMEKAVISTKHIARAINEEVDLQTRLLDELDEEVDVTHSRLKAATLRVKKVMRQSSHWRGGLCIFVLIVVLVTLTLMAFKILRLFGA